MVSKKKIKPPRFFRYFDTTVPVIRQCRSCRFWLAAGIVEGLHAEIDLVALDLIQQRIAILGGTRLYAMRRTGLIELDSYRLQDPKFPVRYPRHRCGVRWPSRLPGGGQMGLESTPDIPPY